MKSFLRIVLSIIPFIYMALIWYMSSNPDDLILDLPSSATDRFIKEALHLVEFAILYVLFVVALVANHKLTAAASLTAAIIAGLYGIIDELHQSFVPARSATLIDVIKDIVGVLAVYFHIQYHYFKHKRGFLTVIERILPKKQRDA